MNFPEKVMPADGQELPIGNVCTALDDLNKDHPIVIKDYESCLPDLTRVVSMNDAIYRINVPGYFCRQIKIPSETASDDSGVLVGRFPEDIDCEAIGVPMYKDSKVSDPLSITYMSVKKGETACMNQELQITDKNGRVLFKGGSKADPKLFNCTLAQLRKSETKLNSKRYSFFVSTGSNGCGVANNMIQVVPDEDTLYQNGDVWYSDSDTFVPNYPSVILCPTSIRVDVETTDPKMPFEAVGLYVYFKGTDERLFAPCHYNHPDCNLITRIRSCEDKYSLDMPTSNSTNESEINAFTTTSEKKIASKTQTIPSGKRPYKTRSAFGHKSYFGTTLANLNTPFFIQDISPVDFGTGIDKSWVGLVSHFNHLTIFDPTTDG